MTEVKNNESLAMSKTATATIRVEYEFEVEQEFNEDASFEDMEDNWNTFINLPEGSTPKEWHMTDVNIEVYKTSLDGYRDHLRKED